MFLEYRLKIRKWLRENKNKIIIVVVIWFVILVINYLLGNKKQEMVLNTTYEPHDILMSNNEEQVPEKLREPIEKIIDDFVNYCNSKEYSKAYSLLSDDCKKNVFDESEDKFKNYVNQVFPNKKIYSIQSYSHAGDFYIYNIKILNNILASGLTDEEYTYYEEKYAISGTAEDLKINVGNYMGKEELKNIAEDDNLKIRITEKTMFYSEEIYTAKITNKTENIAVIANMYDGNEVMLKVDSEVRNADNENLDIVLMPGETKEYKLYFTKFYDEDNSSSSIIFDKIRIMKSYSGTKENYKNELENAVRTYSLGVPLQ